MRLPIRSIVRCPHARARGSRRQWLPTPGNPAVLAPLAVMLVLLAAPGCSNDDGENGGTQPPSTGTFTGTVLPVFQEHCSTSGCHDAAGTAAGLALDSYGHVLAGSDHGEAVIPFSPDQSLMIEMLEGRASSTSPDHGTLLGGAPAGGAGDRAAGGGAAVALAADDLATLRDWITGGCPDDGGTPAFDGLSSKVYVASQGTDHVDVVSVDDLVVARLVAVAPFAGSLEAVPHFGSVAPDNSVWFANLLKAPGVWKFDTHDSLLTTLQTNLEAPSLSVLTPDGSKAYVTHFINPQMPGLGFVSVIDMASFTVTQEIAVLNTPHGIAIKPDGSEVYVGDFGSDHITVIDTATDQVVEHIPVSELVRGDVDSFDYRILQLAMHPTRPLIYVSCSATDEVRVIDREQGTVVDSLTVPSSSAAPWHLKVTADGSKLFSANRGQQLGSGDILPGSVSVFSTDPFALITTIADPAMALPHGLDFDASGRYCFVSSENLNGAYTARHPIDGENPGTLVVIDVTTLEVVKTLELEAFATGVFATR